MEVNNMTNAELLFAYDHYDEQHHGEIRAEILRLMDRGRLDSDASRHRHVAMYAWQILGALWGIHLTHEQARICNWFWNVARGNEPGNLFPINHSELESGRLEHGQRAQWVSVNNPPKITKRWKDGPNNYESSDLVLTLCSDRQHVAYFHGATWADAEGSIIEPIYWQPLPAAPPEQPQGQFIQTPNGPFCQVESGNQPQKEVMPTDTGQHNRGRSNNNPASATGASPGDESAGLADRGEGLQEVKRCVTCGHIIAWWTHGYDGYWTHVPDGKTSFDHVAKAADPAQGQQELWEVVPGEEADDWGIRIVGEIHGKSIAQIMWEHDAKEVVRLHNSAQVQMSAREWWKANRDNFVNGFSGSGLATRSEYDIPAVLEAFTRSRDGGKGNG